jgi:hypothetical protein
MAYLIDCRQRRSQNMAGREADAMMERPGAAPVVQRLRVCERDRLL